MQRDKRKVESALEAKGFRKDETHHHYYFYWTLEGKKAPVRTRTSHTPKEKSLDSARLGEMAHQCGIAKNAFLDLVDCQLDQTGYERLLQADEKR